MRRLRTLPTLAEHGVVQQGTAIEVIPEALPPNSASQDSRVFRATISETAGLRNSIIWEYDRTPYSLTELTIKLQNEHGVACLEHYIFKHWRIAGHMESLWAEAERFPR
jgi:hypothetical protein